MPNINTQAELALFAGTTQGTYTAGVFKAGDMIVVRDDDYKTDILVAESGDCDAMFAEDADAEWYARAHNEFRSWIAEIDKGREAQRKLEDAQQVGKWMLAEFGHYLPETAILRLQSIAGEGGQDE